jgi:energy-coupling factor transporter ATP-binding protein EcfA2
VPQQTALHEELTARTELGLAASLRGLAPEAVDTVVDRALSTVNLTGVADRPIATLSGGERRRVCVAVELLGDPDVLLPDEPTSGLDPVNEYVIMRQLRALATADRAMVVVTHSIAHVDLFDTMLVLGHGGVPLACGPPREILAGSGAASYAELLASGTPQPAAAAPGRVPPAPTVSRPQGTFAVLHRRELLRLRANLRGTVLLLLMAPVFGLFLRALITAHGMAPDVIAPNVYARRVILTLVLSAVWMGSLNAVRSVVKDRAVIRRERLVGVRPVQVVAAKVAVLAELTAVQVIVLTLVAVAGVSTVGRGAALPWPWLELTVDAWAAAFAGGCMALAISAAATGTDRALAVLALVLVPQIVLSGGVMALRDAPVLQPLATLSAARWGLSAAAATTDLRDLETQTAIPVPLSAAMIATARHQDSDSGWDHRPGAWLGDLGALAALSVLSLAVGVAIMSRPPR